MRCLFLWSMLLTTVRTACKLDRWGLPVSEQDPRNVFTVPAIIPLHIHSEDYFYSPGVQLAEVGAMKWGCFLVLLADKSTFQ